MTMAMTMLHCNQLPRTHPVEIQREICSNLFKSIQKSVHFRLSCHVAGVIHLRLPSREKRSLSLSVLQHKLPNSAEPTRAGRCHNCWFARRKLQDGDAFGEHHGLKERRDNLLQRNQQAREPSDWEDVPCTPGITNPNP